MAKEMTMGMKYAQGKKETAISGPISRKAVVNKTSELNSKLDEKEGSIKILPETLR